MTKRTKLPSLPYIDRVGALKIVFHYDLVGNNHPISSDQQTIMIEG